MLLNFTLVILRCCARHVTVLGGGVGWDNNVIGLAFSCTSTHTSYYAAVRSHALSHIRHAALTGFVATLPHARNMREHTLPGAFS